MRSATRRSATLARNLLSLLFFGLFCQESPPKPPPAITPQAEYTARNPGEWTLYMASHLPRAMMNIEGDRKLRVYLDPDQPGGDQFDSSHYIEKIGLMDEMGRVVALQNFSRDHNRPYVADFPIPEGGISRLKLFARCNLHDLWSAPVMPQR